MALKIETREHLERRHDLCTVLMIGSVIAFVLIGRVLA